eukprot:486958-Pyramimonas_sp.AAC.1
MERDLVVGSSGRSLRAQSMGGRVEYLAAPSSAGGLAATPIDEELAPSQASEHDCALPPSIADADLAADDLQRIDDDFRVAWRRRDA